MSKAPRRKQKNEQPMPKEEEEDVRTLTSEKEREYEESLTELWELLNRSNKETREKIIAQLDEKTVTALRTLKNPYKKPVYGSGKKGVKRALAFSYMNCTEKYAQRLAMTSLIGFIYRMLDEYKPPEAENLMSENDPQFAKPYYQRLQILERKRPEELLLRRFNEIKAILEKGAGAGANAPEAGIDTEALLKESYEVRAKIYKYRIHLVRADVEEVRLKLEEAEREMQMREGNVKSLERYIPVLERKYKKRLAIDEEKRQAGIEVDDGSKVSNPTNPVPQRDATSGARTWEHGEVSDELTPDDLAKPSGWMKEALEARHKEMVVFKERLEEIRKKYSEKKEALAKLEERLKDLNQKFKQLKIEYNEEVQGMTAKKAAVPSALNNHDLDELEVDKYEATEEDYDEIAAEVKKELKIEETAEEYTAKLQDKIQTFLDEYFRYNPDKHVRFAYKPNYEDPSRTPLKTDEEGRVTEETPERSIIPPDDTFFRWKRYMQANYEELRQATDDIYCEKSDFEAGYVPYEVFEGTEKEITEAFDDFKRKYAKEFEAEIMLGTFGQWNLLGPWEQNRKKLDFYSANTEIIKRIIDKNREDEAAGVKLMKDRAEKSKKETAKKYGPDAPSFKSYRRQNPSSLERHGVEPIDRIDAKDVPRDADESTKDEVEVGVHVIKPAVQNGRRLVRGRTEQWKFHIPAEEMPEGSAEMMSPAEFHKRMTEQTSKKPARTE